MRPDEKAGSAFINCAIRLLQHDQQGMSFQDANLSGLSEMNILTVNLLFSTVVF